MNITGITSEAATSNVVREKEPERASWGEKGDIIEGVVKKVSDKITIDFNGKEMNISKSTVQDAREGEKIKFQIMDVSSNRIVLKALGNESGGAGHIAFTAVETGSAADILEQEKSEKEVGSEKYNHIGNTTTEDVREASVAQDGVYISIEEYTLGAFDRLLEAISSKKLLEQSAIEGQQERIRDIRRVIEQSAVKGRLPDGISGPLAEYFVKYDIPVTDDKLENLAAGMAQIYSVDRISESAACHILKNDLAITASNIYNAMYSNVSLSDTIDEDAYGSIEPQVQGIVTNAGYEWNEGMRDRVRFLFANEIPINEDTLAKQDALLEIQDDGFDYADAAEKMLTAIAAGGRAASAVLAGDAAGGNEGADDITGRISLISDDDINSVIQRNNRITIGELYAESVIRRSKTSDNERNNDADDSARDADSRQNAADYDRALKARRQLEEIRLSMTVSAARTLADRGINIDTTELSELVDNLREIERERLKDELSVYGRVTDADADTIVMTQHYRRELGAAPSYILHDIARTSMSDNMEGYAGRAVRLTEAVKRAEGAYEPLMTSPRADMGDSIQKAFRNIDDILETSGLDVTDENRRIVKILAHNRMAITDSNIGKLKDYDARMQNIIENLKPATTLALIRSGVNPLDVSLAELETHIGEINREIAENNADNGEASHSRFLWKLEKENRISEDERESYIGICRLLHQISKNDRAAVGAVVNSGAEFTLANLMTAVRSRRRDIDVEVDDTSGLYDGRGDTREIESMIRTGYGNHVAEKLNDSITPSKLYDVSGGEVETLLSMPLEQLLDNILHMEENQEIENSYMKYLAQNAREAAQDAESIAFAKAFGIEPTLYNINAVRQFMTDGGGALRQLIRESGESSEKDTVIQESDKLIEAMSDDETMKKQYGKVAQAARTLLERNEHGKLDIRELHNLRVIEGGLKVTTLMAKKRSFEIPIVTKNGVTNINLTIVDGAKEKSGINIQMESDYYGNISCELDIRGNHVQGLMLTGKHMDDVALSGKIRRSIEENGYTLVSFNNAVHNVRKKYVRPDDGAMGEENSGRKEQIDKMYKLSKAIITTLSDMIKEEQI
ncbi:MAG: hypothetical protein HFH14_03850 [Lachnospiraceae bacterium]|nr:hypothetical protein [Lachnospiraceae bacterium]